VRGKRQWQKPLEMVTVLARDSITACSKSAFERGTSSTLLAHSSLPGCDGVPVFVIMRGISVKGMNSRHLENRFISTKSSQMEKRVEVDCHYFYMD